MTGTWILRPLALTFTAALAVAVLPASAATSTASPLGAVTSVPSVAEQTPATGSKVVKDVTAPTWASGARLLASVGGTNRIVVTWPAARDNVKVTGYVLYRGTRQVGTASAGVRQRISVRLHLKYTRKEGQKQICQSLLGALKEFFCHSRRFQRVEAAIAAERRGVLVPAGDRR